MHDIKATSAFLKKKGFKCIMYWAEFNGMLAVDGKTRSSLFFPANMSLEEAEKKIIRHRKLFGVSEKTRKWSRNLPFRKSEKSFEATYSANRIMINFDWADNSSN
ncbi:hypothetical protein JW960_16970 [candidate division KSB1 bacterium]|nr:hypothetical protein [candidate division KSB1 bacterium]